MAKDTVVLLHGILRTNNCMRHLEKAFKEAGYNTINITYPSRKMTIEALAETVLRPALADLPTEGEVHFVTHSMGGLLTQAYFDKHKPANLGRVVMLSPPNQGSEIADFLKKHPALSSVFRKVFGDAGQQLGTDIERFKSSKGVDYELGIIAGTKRLNPLGPLLIKRPSDGTVAVDATKIRGMKEHLVLHVDHLTMVKDKEVIQQSLHFIQEGNFSK